MNLFKDFNLKETSLKFIELNKFEVPTLIQKAVIPNALRKRDVIAVSETGSGKTHAFLIPIINEIDVNNPQVQVVITSPTRELAYQTYQFALLMKEVLPDLKIRLVTGGRDLTNIKDNQPHIVIGTPGKIKDLFINQEVLRVDTTKIFVVDEADMTFDLGFLNDVDTIAGKMPKDLQILVFSATIPQEVRNFLDKYLNNPKLIEIESTDLHQKYIEHILIPVKHRTYENTLLNILKGINPYICLIFANSREEAIKVQTFLLKNGIKSLEIHGGLSTRKRQQALKEILNQNMTYIVATDIAARGLDIEGVTHVVSLGFPADINFYLHRSGRTGRNQKHGYCYALYKPSELNSIKKVMNKGVSFKHHDYKGDKWVDLKPLFMKKTFKSDYDLEIAKIVNRKNVKVKPGYKRKQKTEIEKIKRKKRREMIQTEIAKQKKERAKEKQRNKRGEK